MVFTPFLGSFDSPGSSITKVNLPKGANGAIWLTLQASSHSALPHGASSGGPQGQRLMGMVMVISAAQSDSCLLLSGSAPSSQS